MAVVIIAVTLMDGKRSAALLNWIVTGYVATPSLVDPTFDTFVTFPVNVLSSTASAVTVTLWPFLTLLISNSSTLIVTL